MSNPNLRIPEPVLPEHALIRDSAPVPELSVGFKQKVMSDCSTRIAQVTRARRWKAASAVAAVCSAALLIAVVLPMSDESDHNVANEVPEPVPSYSTDSLGYPTGSSPIALDKVKPSSNAPEKSLEQLMESLDQRQQMFEANMLPKFR